MFHPLGHPPGYQRAAWAAAGLPEPPGAIGGYTLAEAVAIHEARKQGRGEGFVAGAAAAAEEARHHDEERDAAIRWAMAQAAEARSMAHQALQAAQQQQSIAQHLQRELEKAKHRIALLECETLGWEGPRDEPRRPDLAAEEEPLSKRLRALHVNNDKS